MVRFFKKEEKPSPQPTPPPKPLPSPPLSVHITSAEGIQVVQYYTSIGGELVALTTRALKEEGLGLGAEAKVEAGLTGVSAGGKGEYVTSRLWEIDAKYNPNFIGPDGLINAQAFSRIAEASARAGTAIPVMASFKPWEEGHQLLDNTGATLDVNKNGERVFISSASVGAKFVVATVKPPETSN